MSLPRLTSPTLRPMHMRGIVNCIKAGMTNLDEIALASGLYSGEQVEAALTKVQKMNIAKIKKKTEKPKKKADKKAED